MSRDVERILQAVPVDAYIGKYVSLRRKGNNLWGLCPFHNEKTPSFSVSPEKGIFKCFGCGKGGNVISFVMEYEHIDFPRALRQLAEYAGIELEGKGILTEPNKDKKKFLADLQNWVAQLYQRQLPGSRAEAYLKERGVTPEAMAHFKLGYAPEEYRFLENQLQRRLSGQSEQQKIALENLYLLGLLGTNAETKETYNRFRGRLLFPIQDLQGNTIAFGGRILEPRENTGKYINSPEHLLFQKKNNLFHLYEAKEEIRKAGMAILVEGYFDVLGLWERNIRNVVAPMGTAFTPEQAKLLKRYSNKLILFLDSDPAGVEAAYKALNIARGVEIDTRVVIRSGGDGKIDPFDLSRQKSTEELLLILDDARDEVSFTLWYFFNYKYNILQFAEKKRALLDFFNHIRSFSREFEREAYLKAAADLLRIDYRILAADYQQQNPGRELVAVSSSAETVKPAVVTAKASRRYKDVLALLLRYPQLWAEESILRQFSWENNQECDKLYLLYTFFRDRFQGGEAWSWENLNLALSELKSTELRNELSGLILDYDEKFQQEITQAKDPVAAAREKLRNTILNARIDSLQVKQQSLQQELITEEKLNSPRVEELTLSLDEVQKELSKLRSFLTGKVG